MNQQALAALCGGGVAVCSGLPPTSCAAFGAAYQQRLDDPMQCVECEAIWKIALLFGCLVCLLLVAAATYIRLILRHSRLKVAPALPQDSAPFAPLGFSGG